MYCHYLLGFFLLYIIATVWIIRRLLSRIRIYERDWECIEKLTDANEDGDVIIHIHSIPGYPKVKD